MTDNFNTDDLVLEERRFSSEDQMTRLFAASASSLNLNTLINYVASPLDLQLRFLCMAVQRFSKQHKDEEEKIKNVKSYFVSEVSRILIAAKEQLKTKRTPITVSLRLSRYGMNIQKLGNLLNLQFKKADKYQTKSGFIPKQVQIDINDIFNKILKDLDEKYIKNQEEIEEEGESTKTQSDTGKIKSIKITLNLQNIDLSDHFKKVDDIMDRNKVGIYEIKDKTTNMGYYEIFFLDDVDQRIVDKIKTEISKIK